MLSKCVLPVPRPATRCTTLTRFPGGIKSINFEKLIAKAPERVIETAVKGMLPKNPLGRDMYRKLKVYKGANHPHTAQQPQELKI